MATSPCPHTEYLKPMARFHLPLASEDETIYRTTSMFLLAQYFLYKDGKTFSLELDSLTNIYEELKIIRNYSAFIEMRLAKLVISTKGRNLETLVSVEILKIPRCARNDKVC